MINPEALNLSALPSVPLSDRKQLPPAPGIYFAISGGQIQYIGRSVNIRQRWADHHRTGQLGNDTHIAYLEVSDPALLPEIETALIEWFNPPLNGTRQWNWLGRKKKTDRTRRSVRFDNKALAMLQIYAERNGLDVTSALNQLLLTHLRAMGLEPEAESVINQLKGDSDDQS